MIHLALGAGFKHAVTFLSPHSAIIQCVLTVAMVAGMNKLIKVAAFECPCVMEADLNLTYYSHLKWNCPVSYKAIYSSMFIFGPAAVLLFLGVIINTNCWRKTTVCYRAKCECCSLPTAGVAQMSTKGNSSLSDNAQSNETSTEENLPA